MRQTLLLLIFLVVSSCRSTSPRSSLADDDTPPKKKKIIVLDLGGPIILNEKSINNFLAIVDSYQSLFKRTPKQEWKPSIPTDPVFTDEAKWHEYRNMRLAEAKFEFEKLKAAVTEEESNEKSGNAKDIYNQLQKIRDKYEAHIRDLQSEEKSVLAKIDCLKSDQCEKDLGFAELDLRRIRDSYRTAQLIYLQDRTNYVDYLRKSVNFEWDKLSCVIKPTLLETKDKKKIHVFYGEVSSEWKKEEYAFPTSSELKYFNGYLLPFNEFAIASVQRDLSKYKGKATEWIKGRMIEASDWIDLADEFDVFRVFANNNRSVQSFSGETYVSADPSFDQLFPKICADLVKKQNETFSKLTEIKEMQTQAKVLASECSCWSNVRQWKILGRSSYNH